MALATFASCDASCAWGSKKASAESAVRSASMGVAVRGKSFINVSTWVGSARCDASWALNWCSASRVGSDPNQSR